MLKLESIRNLLATGVLAILCPIAATAGIHTWDVREVFSNADGTIQFVELWEADGGAGEINVGNGTVSSSTNSHSIGNGQVEPPTTNKSYLLATADFAALPGAPTPDEIIPAGMLPFFFSTAGDTVSFVGWDSWTFGAVPTNGISSLDRISGVGPNSPRNYAGDTASVDASGGGGPDVPLLPGPMIAFATLLVMGVGVGYLMTRRSASR